MASFSHYDEYDGETMNWLVLSDIFNDALDNYNTDYIYWSVLVKNFCGKNIEIKITDIEKDKQYHQNLLDKEIG